MLQQLLQRRSQRVFRAREILTWDFQQRWRVGDPGQMRLIDTRKSHNIYGRFVGSARPYSQTSAMTGHCDAVFVAVSRRRRAGLLCPSSEPMVVSWPIPAERSIPFAVNEVNGTKRAFDRACQSSCARIAFASGSADGLLDDAAPRHAGLSRAPAPTRPGRRPAPEAGHQAMMRTR